MNPATLMPVMLRALILISCLACSAQAQRSSRSARATKEPEPPSAPAAPDSTAIGALDVIPRDAAAQVARIEGPDGRPFPERWYVLVHDPAQPRGLREFVLEGGKLVSGRTMSQFADSITADEVVGAQAIKVNSDRAAGIAAQFAMHNQKQLGSINYELIKATAPAVPVWRLTCLGGDGEMLGTLVIHATRGSVLSFQGFEKSPVGTETVSEPPPPSSSPGDTPATETSGAVAAKKRPSAKRDAESNESPRSGQTTSGGERERYSEAPPARAVRARRPPPPRRGPIDRVGGIFRRIFD